MNKKLLTLAVAAAMVAPLAVQAAGTGPTVYGVAHLAVETIDDDSTNVDSWRVNSRQSLFGIKGSEDLGNGLSAIYKMEFQVDQDRTNDTTGYGLQDSNAGLSSRNQYVGLSHKNYGTLTLGRQDDVIKMLTISRDMFNTKLGDWNEVQGATGVDNMEEKGADRQNNAILYKSPKFSGFEVAAMVAPGESAADDGIADEFSSIGARYTNGPIYVAAGWEEYDNDNANNTNEEETWRLVASYDIAGFRLSGMYHETENVNLVNNIDAETWQLAASYTFGNTVVKGMWQEGEQDVAAAADMEYEAFALGVDHNFSKRTQVYAVYTQTEDERSGSNNDTDAFGVGLKHKF